MVTNVTNLGRSGLSDWMMQRITAVVLGAYFLMMMGFFACHPQLTYEEWRSFMGNSAVRIASLVSFLAIGGHAWVGLWTISTDYFKPTGIRFLFQAACGLALIVYFVWGVQILWGF